MMWHCFRNSNAFAAENMMYLICSWLNGVLLFSKYC